MSSGSSSKDGHRSNRGGSRDRGEGSSSEDGHRSNRGGSRDRGEGSSSEDGYRSSRGGSRGRGGGGGGGRGSGRQRVGKFWRVKACLTPITGTIPQPMDADTEQDHDNPPIVPDDMVYLVPKKDSQNRFVLELFPDLTFVHNGATQTARWFSLKFHTLNHDKWYKTYSQIPPQKILEWFSLFKEKKKPAVIHDDAWKKWLDWWNDPEAKKQAKRNRENGNKVQVVATGGPVSLADHTNRMKRKHGNHIDEGDTFAALHTRRGKNGEFLWACDASGKVYDSYKVKAKEKAIIEGSIDPEVDPNAKVAFDRYAWNEAATEFKKAEGKQAFKGYRLVGFGEGGKKVLNIPTARPGFYYPDSPMIAPYLDQTVMEERLRESNEKTQRLEEQVGKLSEMCKILLEEKEERERQQTMMSQRGPSWCSPMGYFPPSGMFPPGGLYSQHQSQYNYQFQQMQQQNSRQSSASPNSGGRGSGNGNGGGSGGGNGGYGLYMDMLRDGAGVNFNFGSGLGGGNSGGWARGSGNGGGNNV